MLWSQDGKQWNRGWQAGFLLQLIMKIFVVENCYLTYMSSKLSEVRALVDHYYSQLNRHNSMTDNINSLLRVIETHFIQRFLRAKKWTKFTAFVQRKKIRVKEQRGKKRRTVAKLRRFEFFTCTKRPRTPITFNHEDINREEKWRRHGRREVNPKRRFVEEMRDEKKLLMRIVMQR